MIIRSLSHERDAYTKSAGNTKRPADTFLHPFQKSVSDFTRYSSSFGEHGGRETGSSSMRRDGGDGESKSMPAKFETNSELGAK